MCELTHCPHCGLRLDDPDQQEIGKIRQRTVRPKVERWPYRTHVPAEELCTQSGLTATQYEALVAARLLVPEGEGRYFRRKLVSWAKKLAHLLNEGWSMAEIKRWSRERWQTGNPRQWPPKREQFFKNVADV